MAEALAPDAWRRVAPISVLHFAIKGFFDAVRHGWQGFVAGGLGAASTDRIGLVVMIGAGALLLGLLVYGVLRYIFFRYKADDARFEVRQGVLQRQLLTLNFGRVQSVAIVEPIYFRPFGVVSLRLESAGSSAQEVDIAGIGRERAETLRRRILAHRAALRANDAATAGSDTAEAQTPSQTGATSAAADIAADSAPPFLSLSLGEVARHGLCSNNIWLFAAALGSIFGSMPDGIGDRLSDWVEAWIDTLIGSNGMIAAVAGVVAFILLVLALVALLSVIASIFLYKDFRLYREADGLRRRAGLLETREAALLDSKVQCLVRHQTAIGRLLKRSEARVVQAGGQADNNPYARKQVFLVPAVTDAIFARLLNTLYGENATASAPALRGIHRLYIRKTLQYTVAGPALILAGGLSLAIGWWALTALALPVVAWPLVLLSWRRYGYAFDSEYGRVQSGLIGSSLTVFPLFKVQTVTLSQSPAQRRRELASLRILLAGRALTLPYIPLAEAHALRDRLLYAAESDRRPWM